jgi:hypothetical protein
MIDSGLKQAILVPEPRGQVAGPSCMITNSKTHASFLRLFLSAV